MEAINTYRATGRRKESIARVVLSPGTGKVRVNKREIEKYFLRETDKLIALQPFKATSTENKFDVEADCFGGGLTGQAGAIRLGISRALSSMDLEYKAALKKVKYLTRDPRTKERKKYGQKGARKRFQWTKR